MSYSRLLGRMSLKYPFPHLIALIFQGDFDRLPCVNVDSQGKQIAIKSGNHELDPHRYQYLNPPALSLQFDLELFHQFPGVPLCINRAWDPLECTTFLSLISHSVPNCSE